MRSNSLLLRATLVVVLGITGLLTVPKPAAAADQCGQCVTTDICMFMGDAFCQQTCGLPFAGCVVDEQQCGSPQSNMRWIICSNDQ